MKKSDLERNISHYKNRMDDLQGKLQYEQLLLERAAENCKELGVKDLETCDKASETVTPDQYWAICRWETHKYEVAKLSRLIEESSLVLSHLKKKLEYEIYRLEIHPIPALEELLNNWEELAKAYYIHQVSCVTEWKSLQQDPDIEYPSQFSKEVIGYSRMNLEFFNKSLEYTLKTTKHHRKIDIYENFYTICAEYIGDLLDTSNLQVVNNTTVQGEVIGEVGTLFVIISCITEFTNHDLKYSIEVQPIENTQEQTSDIEVLLKTPYKELTLDQLKYIAAELKVPFKEYSDDRITRMRLVMAIKQERTSE